MLASGRLSASTVPACRRSINRPASHRHPCPAAPAVLVSPSPTPIPQRNATGRRLDSTSSNLTPRPNPHRARGTDGAPTSRDFVPRRFSDAGHPSAYQGRHRRRPKTCTKPAVRLSWVERVKPTRSSHSRPRSAEAGFRAVCEIPYPARLLAIPTSADERLVERARPFPPNGRLGGGDSLF